MFSDDHRKRMRANNEAARAQKAGGTPASRPPSFEQLTRDLQAMKQPPPKSGGLKDFFAKLFGGKEPDLALVVEVERAFFHCSKCMIRSGLWQPGTWTATSDLPTLAEAMKTHGRLDDPLEALDEIIATNARTRLY